MVVVAACDNGNGLRSTPKTSAQPAHPPLRTATESPSPDSVVFNSPPAPLPFLGVEILFDANWMNPAGRDEFKREIAKLKDLTGIRVNPEFGDHTTFHDHFAKYTFAPDIWLGGELGWGSRALHLTRGLALDLSEYVASWNEWEDYYPDVREEVVNEGEIRGLPFRTYYRGSVAIRPSMFEAARLPAVPPSTWEELNEVAHKLTIRDDSVFVQAGFNLQHDRRVFADWLVQAGGDWFDADLRPSINTPEGQNALIQHVRHGLIDQTMPIEGVQPEPPHFAPFCAGRIAIQSVWPGRVGYCQYQTPNVFDDLLVGPPLMGSSQRAMKLYVDKYVGWRGTKHPDAVFETMKYLAAPGPNYEINVLPNRAMPCRKAMERYDLYLQEPWRTFMNNIQFTRNLQDLPQRHGGEETAIKNSIKGAALGDLSVEEALIMIDEVLREAMGW